MPEYTIRDPQTGREVKVRGDSPPTGQDIDFIFSSMPQPIEAAPTEPERS